MLVMPVVDDRSPYLTPVMFHSFPTGRLMKVNRTSSRPNETAVSPAKMNAKTCIVGINAVTKATQNQLFV